MHYVAWYRSVYSRGQWRRYLKSCYRHNTVDGVVHKLLGVLIEGSPSKLFPEEILHPVRVAVTTGAAMCNYQ